MRGELEAANDRALRARAEIDNVRKRARRELNDELRYANLPLLRELLPVLDNIQRAIQAAEKNPDGSGLLEGVRMVAQSLQSTLARFDCQRIEALSRPFDPQFHEALAQLPSSDVPAGTVLEVVQEGFTLHDRVVRPAQVIVSSGPPTA
jgi:molecular chaperone GrpE